MNQFSQANLEVRAILFWINFTFYNKPSMCASVNHMADRCSPMRADCPRDVWDLHMKWRSTLNPSCYQGSHRWGSRLAEERDRDTQPLVPLFDPNLHTNQWGGKPVLVSSNVSLWRHRKFFRIPPNHSARWAYFTYIFVIYIFYLINSMPLKK